MILKYEHVMAARSSSGAWGARQLALIGVSWPPVRGWIGVAVGKEFPDEVIRAFIDLKDAHQGRKCCGTRKGSGPHAPGCPMGVDPT
jgi:hypothetical protein